MVLRKKGEDSHGRRGAVIFDFDGTIADSFPYVFDFLKQVARNTKHYTPEEIEASRKMSMKRLALHLGVPVWQLLPTYFRGRHYLRQYMRDVKAFAGMPELIRQLHVEGWQLFIASANSGRNIRALLRHLQLGQYFTTVRGGSGFMGKPRLLNYIVQRYRLDKSQTWYVGDETGDIVSATASGLHSIAVGWGFADPAKLKLVEPHATADVPGDIAVIVEAEWKKWKT